MLNLLRATTLLLALSLFSSAGSDPSASETGAAPGSATPTEVLNRYLVANQKLQARFRDSTMEIEVNGRLLRLKREATLHALRQIGRLGQITFEEARSEGDKTVIKDLIYRYLTAESEASKGIKDSMGNVQSIAISLDNYKFKHKTTMTTDGRTVYVYQVTPKKNRLGLFKGEVWVDGESGLPLRESGQFVKSPSKFLRRLKFVRQYELHDDIALPVKIESSVETFLYGKAEVDVRLSNFSVMQTAQSKVSPPAL